MQELADKHSSLSFSIPLYVCVLFAPFVFFVSSFLTNNKKKKKDLYSDNHRYTTTAKSKKKKARGIIVILTTHIIIINFIIFFFYNKFGCSYFIFINIILSTFNIKCLTPLPSNKIKNMKEEEEKKKMSEYSMYTSKLLEKRTPIYIEREIIKK